MDSGASSMGFPWRDLTFKAANFDRTGYGTVDLGTFSLGDRFSVTGGTFDLDITFKRPQGTTANGDFLATLSASVAADDGGLSLTFHSPTTQVFSYSGGDFYLSLLTNPISIRANRSADLVGTIMPSPEPITVALAGGGLTLVGLVRVRRSQKK